MTSGGTRLIPLTIAGPAGALEALLQQHEGVRAELAALVCHPHPSYGGTLHNKVAHRIASTLHALGATVLRFNFRGVGKSEGRFDQGEGELDDARAALVELRHRAPGARCWIAGFSFGSWIGTRLATSDAGIERLILVAPPVSTHDFSMLISSKLPKLIIQGTADTNCRPEALAEQLPLWSEPKKLVLIEGATHFFDRQLGALGEALKQELEGPATHPVT